MLCVILAIFFDSVPMEGRFAKGFWHWGLRWVYMVLEFRLLEWKVSWSVPHRSFEVWQLGCW